MLSGTKAVSAMILTVIVTMLSVLPAAATTTYTDTVQGHEVFFTSTEGVFAGSAAGELPGTWFADVLHDPLGTSAAITGGSFSLWTTTDGQQVLVVGSFSGGSVVQQSGFSGCTNQTYAVSGSLDEVGVVGTALTGTGNFN